MTWVKKVHQQASRREFQVTRKYSPVALVLALGLMPLISLKVHERTYLGFAAPGPSMGAAAAEEIPPYHASAPPEKSLPATLDPAQFRDAITQNAYAMAAKVKRDLYQQPCYCHCDKELGHASLLDCYTGTHAAVCNVCKWEGIYVYNEAAKKKSAAQIREGILKGEWKKVDLTKYKEYKPKSGGN